MNIPNNGTVTGKCGKIEQNLTLSWELQDSAENSFTLHFLKNETEKYYSLHHLEIVLAPEKKPDGRLNTTFTCKSSCSMSILFFASFSIPNSNKIFILQMKS